MNEKNYNKLSKKKDMSDLRMIVVMMLVIVGSVVDAAGKVGQRVPVVTSVLASVPWVGLGLARGRVLSLGAGAVLTRAPGCRA